MPVGDVKKARGMRRRREGRNERAEGRKDNF